jgi:hypothetical protein
MSESLLKSETAEVLYERFHDLLLGHNLVEADEVKAWFSSYQFKMIELKTLASTTLHNLQLRIEH